MKENNILVVNKECKPYHTLTRFTSSSFSEHKLFRFPCDTCGKMFQRYGRSSKYCDECKEKRHKLRMKKLRAEIEKEDEKIMNKIQAVITEWEWHTSSARAVLDKIKCLLRKRKSYNGR